MNIFVGNLNFQTSEEELQNAFAPYGEITSVRIVTDKFSGRSRGFGFIEMPNQEEAEKAINELNNHTLNSRMIVVNEAKPQENNSRSNTSNRY